MAARIGLRGLVLLGALVCVAATAFGDTLVLKDGTAVQGSYMGGSAQEVQFESGGVTKSYPLHAVTTLTLAPRPAPPTAVTSAAAPAVAAAVAAAPLTGPVEVPAGTKLMINFVKPVSTASHPKGSTFEVVLEQNLVVSGQVAAAKGTPVYGQVLEARGGKKLGAQYLSLTLTGLSINDAKVPITTEGFGVEGGRGETAKTVGAGALVGAAIDGGSGAATGAAIAGAVVLLAPGAHVQFPAGTILEVPLKAAVTIAP